MAVIDMRMMRYINLLDRIAHVKTRKCFVHNNNLFFAVEKNQVSKAIGPAALNIKKIQEQIGCRVRIIRDADGIEDARRFVEDIIEPINIKSLEVNGDSIMITAGGMQVKASLIGRNKRRYEELKKIIHDFFGKDLKIV